jgi:hypothetical protein
MLNPAVLDRICHLAMNDDIHAQAALNVLLPYISVDAGSMPATDLGRLEEHIKKMQVDNDEQEFNLSDIHG